MYASRPIGRAPTFGSLATLGILKVAMVDMVLVAVFSESVGVRSSLDLLLAEKAARVMPDGSDKSRSWWCDAIV